MDTRRPNFFLIGAPKCGTSAMASYLSEHPAIFFTTPKEPFYWCSDYPELAHEMGVTSLAEYLRLFARAQPNHIAVGEGSTRYLSSDVAVPRIMEFAPGSRIIVMLRNPVEAVQSIHAELCFRFWEEVPDFEPAWRLQDERKAGRQLPKVCPYPEFLQYGRMYSYSWQIERLFSRVPRDQVLVLLFDDLAKNPRDAYLQALAFLNVPDDGRSEFPKVRESQAHRFPRLSRWLMNPPPVVRGAVTWLKNRVRRIARPEGRRLVSALKVKQPRPGIRPEFAQELREYFSRDVARLSEFLDRDLTHWTAGH